MDWRCGRFLLQPAQRRLLCDGVPVDVEERVFDLIALLVQHHDRALDRREVIDALWGPRPVSDNTLRQVVYKARRALGDDGDRQNVIRTLHGRSLQWVAPLQAVPAATIPESVAVPVIAARPPVASKRRHWFAAASAIVLSVIAVVLWMPRAQAPANAVTLPRLAIEPIDNATGDTTLNWISNGLPGLLAGLIGNSGDLSVIDPLQTVRAWQFKPTQGRTRERQLRFVTGADVLVGGSLHRLTANFYELRLRVIPADGAQSDLTLTGEKPSLLAVNAVQRIRRALHLDHPEQPTQSPHDAFAAEAYARGVDMAAHGNWLQARTHFKVCVENVPGFLPAYVKLGQAQYRSNQMSEGKQTLQTALTLARENKDNSVAAQALMALGDLESHRQQNVAALQLMQQADIYAQRSGDFSLQAENTLHMSETNSALLHLKQARAQLAQAGQLIAAHNLRGLRTALFAAQRELANHAGDKAAEEAASRALLVENEAIGNQHGAVGSLLSLARVKLEQADFNSAATLLQYAYTQAAAYDDAFLTVVAADYLASTLLDLGVDGRVDPIADNMIAIAARQHNPAWSGLAIVLHGASAQYRGDAAKALHYYQQAYALLDAKQEPAHAVGTLLLIATTAYQAQPGLLPTLSKDVDGIVSAQPDPKPYRTTQLLVHAMTKAAAHQPDAALASLRQAADGKSGEALDSNVRMVAFVIGHDNPAAAAVALKGFNAANWKSAAELRFYSLWAASQGDRHDYTVAQDHIMAMRAGALQALNAPVVNGAVAHN